jgi:hypothetical protein
MPTPLPPKPHLDHLRKQARRLLCACRSGDPEALRRLRAHLTQLRQTADTAPQEVTLQSAQCVLAREYGFPNWSELTRAVEIIRQAGAAMLGEIDGALERGQSLHVLIAKHVAGETRQRLARHCGQDRVLLLEDAPPYYDNEVLVAALARAQVVVSDPSRLGFAVMYERLQVPEGPRPLAGLLGAARAFVNAPAGDERTPLVISGPDGESGGARDLISMYLGELYGLYVSMADYRY